MAEYKKIHFKELLLDSENPRLPKSMGNKSEKEIINFFLSDASLLELMLAIGTNGFFDGEQLLVIPLGNNYKVIEGNRRLSAVKLLNDSSLAEIYKSKVTEVIKESTYTPDYIPCLIFQEKEEITKYLGYRHITGIKSWKLLEKARYMEKLRREFYSDIDLRYSSREIAKMIGSRKDYVLRILTGYQIFETIEKTNYYNIDNLNDVTFHFNYLADSLSRPNIERFLGVDLNQDEPLKNLNFHHLKELVNWMFNKDLPNKIIGDSEHLNMLNKVLKNKTALSVFRNGEKLKVAVEYTDEIDVQFENAISESIVHLEKADSLTLKVQNFYMNLNDDLKIINSLIKKIKNTKEQIELGSFDDEF